MKKLVRLMFKNKLVAGIIMFLMLVALSYTSISFAKAINKTETKMEEKTEYCAWYKRRLWLDSGGNQVGVKIWFCDGSIGHAGTQGTPDWKEEYCECFPEEGK